MNEPAYHETCRPLSRPLTLLGAERGLFMAALLLGWTTFYAASSLLDGIFVFAVLYGLALWATSTDPQIVQILLRAAKQRVRYDPARRSW